MRHFLSTGHRVACDSSGGCRCLILTCTVAGTLTLLATIATAVAGMTSSLAVLSDAPHAATDSAGYFVAAFVMARSASAQLGEPIQKRLGKGLALLLLLSVALIGYEAMERLVAGTHVVRPAIAMLPAAFAILMNALSWRLIAAGNFPHDRVVIGLIGHAKSDTYHSACVFLMTVVAAAFGDRLPLAAIDFSTTGLVLAYVTVVALFMWRGKHFHLPVRKTLNRLLGTRNHAHCGHDH